MITLNDLIHLGTGLSIFFIAAWVYCMLAFCIEMISLWADNIWSLMVMTRFLFFFFGGAFIPVQFFPEWLQKNLTYTPFPYLLNLPARTVMGKTTPDEIMWGLTVLVVWGGIFALMGRLVWSRGQFRYSGVGI
jgi:ABC-2 type transport system permease protein